jgi:hypothetical protein
LKDDYGTEVIDFAYGLGMLNVCIEKASDAYGGREGFEDFSQWLEDLSRHVDEGFEYIRSYIDSTELNEAPEKECLGGNPVEEREEISLNELHDLMKEVAGALESELDCSASASPGPGLTDEEEERLELEVESAVEKVTDVGYETYHFLIGAQYHPEKFGGQEAGLQEVESLFGIDAIQLNDFPGGRELESRPIKTQTPARYRAARSDARVGTIKRNIEKTFGLPKGSIAILGPDGKSLRANALVSTVRRRWKQHYQED